MRLTENQAACPKGEDVFPVNNRCLLTAEHAKKTHSHVGHDAAYVAVISRQPFNRRELLKKNAAGI
jgi:hypothetical protein